MLINPCVFGTQDYFNCNISIRFGGQEMEKRFQIVPTNFVIYITIYAEMNILWKFVESEGKILVNTIVMFNQMIPKSLRKMPQLLLQVRTYRFKKKCALELLTTNFWFITMYHVICGVSISRVLVICICIWRTEKDWFSEY